MLPQFDPSVLQLPPAMDVGSLFMRSFSQARDTIWQGQDRAQKQQQQAEENAFDAVMRPIELQKAQLGLDMQKAQLARQAAGVSGARARTQSETAHFSARAVESHALLTLDQETARFENELAATRQPTGQPGDAATAASVARSDAAVSKSGKDPAAVPLDVSLAPSDEAPAAPAAKPVIPPRVAKVEAFIRHRENLGKLIESATPSQKGKLMQLASRMDETASLDPDVADAITDRQLSRRKEAAKARIETAKSFARDGAGAYSHFMQGRDIGSMDEDDITADHLEAIASGYESYVGPRGNWEKDRAAILAASTPVPAKAPTRTDVDRSYQALLHAAKTAEEKAALNAAYAKALEPFSGVSPTVVTPAATPATPPGIDPASATTTRSLFK